MPDITLKTDLGGFVRRVEVGSETITHVCLALHDEDARALCEATGMPFPLEHRDLLVLPDTQGAITYTFEGK